MTMSARTPFNRRVSKSALRFALDEGGTIGVYMTLTFVGMIMLGGIAVDMMRFEASRVALQQTMDRAALAAASLSQTRDGSAIAQEWFDKTQLGQGIEMVSYSDPVVTAVNHTGMRRVTIEASVRSYNFFIGKFYSTVARKDSFLEGSVLSEATQGVTKLEVMLVLDITGSMNDPATTKSTTSKISSLRAAAKNFVDIIKTDDSEHMISIGVVPYAMQVNIPVALRNQFNVTNLSSWDGVASAGVADINCLEIPTSTYANSGVSLTDPIPMAAVADASNTTTTTTDYIAATSGTPNVLDSSCTKRAELTSTTWSEADINKVLLPTTEKQPILDKIARLTADGNTYIAVGMRWGTLLLDEMARPIYDELGESYVQGRPTDNASNETRKVIILMTDGEHVVNPYILDAYKTGLSPIYRGTDGKFAIRFTTGGAALTGGTRPGSGTTSTTSCSGWQLSNYSDRQYFVPHLKRNTVRQKTKSTDTEGSGSGSEVTGACDPLSWVSSPTWSGSGTVRQLDWSEVWRYLRVSYVVRQLYMRSGVSGTGTYTTVYNTFAATYLTSVTNMNTLLNTNCTAAKNAGIEIYGIAFAAPANGQTVISNCSSSPKESYYFNATDATKLAAAFKLIAVDIAPLRLTE